MNAIAYNPRTSNTVFDYGAIKAIENRVVEVMPNARDAPFIIMARAVLLSNKLGFRMGKGIVQMIRGVYNPEMDDDIRAYLEYKNKEEKFDIVKQILMEISGQCEQEKALQLQ